MYSAGLCEITGLPDTERHGHTIGVRVYNGTCYPADSTDTVRASQVSC